MKKIKLLEFWKRIKKIILFDDKENILKLNIIKPQEIEKKSFEMITEILGDKKILQEHENVIKRCIHTSADFEYADNLYFSENAVEIMKSAMKNGIDIVTDTQMGKAGINKMALKQLGIEVHCFIGDEDVAKEAKERGVTRSIVAVEKAIKMNKPLIFVVGNAPTALLRLNEAIKEKSYIPALIVAVPVGFVNVVESKEIIIESGISCIVAKGRKGGSNIGAAICNAVMYEITSRA